MMERGLLYKGSAMAKAKAKAKVDKIYKTTLRHRERTSVYHKENRRLLGLGKSPEEAKRLATQKAKAHCLAKFG